MMLQRISISGCLRLEGSFVFSSLARTTWRMVALLTVSVAVAVLVGYQFHMAVHEPMQTSPAVQHGACVFHTTSHLCNLMAILPQGVPFAPLGLCTPYAVAVGSTLQGFAFPPFIPPKAMLRVPSA